MPLFDFWRKRPNKQAEETKHPQRNPVPLPMQPTSNQSLSSKESEESGKQLILAWIRTGFFDAPNRDEWTIFRRQRRFLEAHLELLAPQIDTILGEMMVQ